MVNQWRPGSRRALSNHSSKCEFPLALVCFADDRASSQPALRISIASLASVSPETNIWVVYPPADADFIAWAETYPTVQLLTEPIVGATGWNVKPSILLAALDRGFDEVVWIDSDIVMAGDWRHLIADLHRDMLVVAEEALWGDHEDGDATRARGWGFDVRRSMPCAANTCFIRVTQAHRGLLEAWRDCLRDPNYMAAQALPYAKRPLHFIGDQDVLTALLCSEAHAKTPVKFIKRGKDVLQVFGLKGFTTVERLRVLLFGPPPLIHSQGYKPWIIKAPDSGIYGILNAVYLDLSPYMIFARPFVSRDDARSSWMEARTRWGKLLRTTGFGSAPLTGLPLAIFFDALFFFARIRRLLERPIPQRKIQYSDPPNSRMSGPSRSHLTGRQV